MNSDLGREANTFNLPSGVSLRREIAAVFSEQREEVLRWLDMPAKVYRDGLPPLDDRDMAERMVPHLGMLWDRAGKKFLPSIGQQPDQWDVKDPSIRAAIRAQALEFSRSTNAASKLGVAEARDKVRDALQRGVATRGEANRTLARRIGQIFDGKHRAYRIAVTEAARAHNAATMLSGDRSGVVHGWKWLPATNACLTCKAIAARVGVVRPGQPFARGLGNHPIYSTVPHPPAHPLCRCTITSILSIDVEFGETMIGPPPRDKGPAGELTLTDVPATSPPPGRLPGLVARKSAPVVGRAQDGRTIYGGGRGGLAEAQRWIRSPGASTNRDAVVLIDVAAFDAAWSRDRGFYVGPGGSGGIAGRYEEARKFLLRVLYGEIAIEMARVSVDEEGAPTISDGRHRFAVLRDSGATEIPVTVPQNEADRLRELYGVVEVLANLSVLATGRTP